SGGGGFETGARAPSSTTGTPGAGRLPPPPVLPGQAAFPNPRHALPQPPAPLQRGRRTSVRLHDGTVGRPVRVRGGGLSRRRDHGPRGGAAPRARPGAPALR